MEYYISVAAQLLQEPRFYKFQLYTAHKNFSILPIAPPPNCGPGCCSTPLNAALMTSYIIQRYRPISSDRDDITYTDSTWLLKLCAVLRGRASPKGGGLGPKSPSKHGFMHGPDQTCIVAR